MKCISCNRNLEKNIGHYKTNSGPLCIVCHDKEIESDDLKLKNNFQKLSDIGVMKDRHETN
jgi:hypothetical protein